MNSGTRTLVLLAMIAAVVGLVGCGQHTDCSTGGFGSHGLSNRGATGSGATCGNGGGLGNGNGGGPSSFTALAYDIDQAGTVDGISFTASSGSGTLQSIPNFVPPTIPTGDPGVGMVVAQQKFVYAVFEVEQEIFGWSIDANTGALTTLSGMPLSVAFTGIPISGFNHLYVATNPAGTLLFISEGGNEQIVVYQISASGALTPVAGSPFSTGIVEPGNLATDSQGKFLYVCEDTGDHNGAFMTAFAIQSDGSLTAVPNTPFNFPMWEVQSDASGKFLIGTSGNSVLISGVDDNNLYVFSINQQTGELTAVGSPVPTVFSPIFIASQPNSSGGSFVYSFSLTTGGYNPVEGYELNTTSGALTALSGSPFSNLSSSIWGQFDQSGAYLFTYSNISGSPELGVLNLDSSGGLSEPTSTFSLGASGYWVVTDPPTI
jgi:6-phosphogluconolactonase (cycloisomerase 2 family)